MIPGYSTTPSAHVTAIGFGVKRVSGKVVTKLMGHTSVDVTLNV